MVFNMKWIFDTIGEVVKMPRNYMMINGKLNSVNMLSIPVGILSQLEKVLDLNPRALTNNCELVVELKAVMLPPNKWYKISKED